MVLLMIVIRTWIVPLVLAVTAYTASAPPVVSPSKTCPSVWRTMVRLFKIGQFSG
jgi:hypothetical protein